MVPETMDRFMSYRMYELARLLKGQAVGEDPEIVGVATLSEAGPGDLAFVESARFLKQAEATAASALIVPFDLSVAGKPLIQVSDPRIAFADALRLFDRNTPVEPYIHPTALLGVDVTVAPSATIMAYAVIGDRVVIGDDVVIHPLAHVGADSSIGEESILFPRVTLYDRVSIGRRVRVHSGVVIGSDGFGYERRDGAHLKVPHIGSVIIEDDVEIGANCTIDRAKTGMTRIGRGTKIDNLVQIGHNVTIGSRCIIVAQVGLCGSVKIGDDVVIGGQAAISEHQTIGDGAYLGARAGVTTDVEPGQVVAGFPARPRKQWLKTKAAANKLPALIDRVREMERQIRDLDRQIRRQPETPADEASGVL